jgi:hypothetical protein
MTRQGVSRREFIGGRGKHQLDGCAGPSVSLSVRPLGPLAGNPSETGASKTLSGA